ncbi:hydrogenase subunit MbhD domain-containing protein [Pararhodobacter sp. SW119]|uniref:hydrogenase subunit MbhD domain-containing protein n=1 Tax=Pararhodobacter sp. SW119 TaxID=2780075 RepID=UPI001ADF534D|nr:hydrogenase subunit MbhD domain-containing protein [Pararhodobacter sp. SW119]
MTAALGLALDAALCALILGVALAVVAGRGVFRAVVFFIVYGLLAAVAWVRLDAVNVALAEAAIGAGLTGVLLLAAHGRLRRAEAAQDLAHGMPWSAALAGGALAAALGWAWFEMPIPVEPGPELAEALPRAGVGNPVTAVLLNFRAWDTLLESIVLLAALIGVWMLAREGDWREPLGRPQHARPGGVMAGFGRVLPPVGLLVGVWLVWAGADHPGGAFQGGTVLAAVGLVAVLAGVIRPPWIGAPLWQGALVLGPAVFLLAGIAGAVLAGGFLTLPEGFAKPAIVTIEVALTVSIAVTLAFLVLGPPEAEGAG